MGSTKKGKHPQVASTSASKRAQVGSTSASKRGRPPSRAKIATTSASKRCRTSSSAQTTKKDIPELTTKESLYRRREKDWRFIFDSGAGYFFKDRLVSKSWDKLFGDDSWFVNVDYVNDFRYNLSAPSSDAMEYSWKEGRQVHKVALTPKLLSEVTGIPIDPSLVESEDCDWSFFSDMNVPLTLELATRIAPYHAPNHYCAKKYRLLMKGMQKNTVAVAKWATLNIFGVYTMYDICGKVAWFVDCLIRDEFPAEFDIHVLLLNVLRMHLHGLEPLPCLTSRLVAHIRKKPFINNVSKPLYSRPSVLLATEISGLWDGTVYAVGDPNRPVLGAPCDVDDPNLIDDVRYEEEDIEDTDYDEQDSEDDIVSPVFAPPVGGMHPVPPYSDPGNYRGMLPYNAYLTKDFLHQVPGPSRDHLLWNQNVIQLHILNHLVTSMKVGLPHIPGFNGDGFRPAPTPSAGYGVRDGATSHSDGFPPAPGAGDDATSSQGPR